MKDRRDLSTQTFGKLLVLQFEQNRFDAEGHKRSFWKCRCDCGAIKVIESGSLTRGKSKSCGTCIKKRKKSHGYCVGGPANISPAYKIWLGMRQRCNNPKNKHYRFYGGRGISICDRWQCSFENFLADMGERPGDLTIDRIDNEGNYEPGNCRWATMVEQRENMRKPSNTQLTATQVSHIRSLKGNQTPLSISKAYGVSPKVIYDVLSNKTWKEILPEMANIFRR